MNIRNEVTEPNKKTWEHIPTNIWTLDLVLEVWFGSFTRHTRRNQVVDGVSKVILCAFVHFCPPKNAPYCQLIGVSYMVLTYLIIEAPCTSIWPKVEQFIFIKYTEYLCIGCIRVSQFKPQRYNFGHTGILFGEISNNILDRNPDMVRGKKKHRKTRWID